MTKYHDWLIVLLLICSISCSNILDFESIESCQVRSPEDITRVWNSVDGLVRYDNDRFEYFIVARYPGDANLTVLRTCNIPEIYLKDRAVIRFFGNEFKPIIIEEIEEESGTAFIVPFEITWIETVRD